MSANRAIWVVALLIVAALIGGYGLYSSRGGPKERREAAPPPGTATPSPRVTPVQPPPRTATPSSPRVTPVEPTTIDEPLAPQPAALSWKIEAEDYDRGGEGVGYHDTTKGNTLPGQGQGEPGIYRDDDVDIASRNPGQIHVAYVDQGEWLAYTMDVPTSGVYYLDLNVSTIRSDRRLHLELDGDLLPGTIHVPITGEWGAFRVITAPAGLSMTQGKHTLKLVFDTPSMNVDWLRFVPRSERPDGVLPAGEDDATPPAPPPPARPFAPTGF